MAAKHRELIRLSQRDQYRQQPELLWPKLVLPKSQGQPAPVSRVSQIQRPSTSSPVCRIGRKQPLVRAADIAILGFYLFVPFSKPNPGNYCVNRCQLHSRSCGAIACDGDVTPAIKTARTRPPLGSEMAPCHHLFRALRKNLEKCAFGAAFEK